MATADGLAATADILKYHSRLSNKLHLEVLGLMQQYVVTCKGSAVEPLSNVSAPAVNLDEDSQDYFDDADGDLVGYATAKKCW